MKIPGRRSGTDVSQQAGDVAPDQPERVNLGEHSAGSAAATIRRVGELLGYVVVASGPASFRLTKPVRRGIRRVDEAVTVSLTNDRDGLWVSYDGPIDPRLMEQLEAEARVGEHDAPAAPPPVANLPDREIARVEPISVRPGAAPQGLIDAVPGMPTGSVPRTPADAVPDMPPAAGPGTPLDSGPGLPANHFPPPRIEPTAGLVVRLPDGTTVTADDGVVIGRDPDVSIQHRCHSGVAVDDPGVSKSHVAVWLADGVINVEDLHSTNGSAVQANGETRRCEPGRPVAVPSAHANLLIGSATVVLERST